MEPLKARLWRMLTVRWQAEPLSGEGAAKMGGRWNRPGTPALYLSFDHGTAIAEFHQSLVRPGTLTAYDVKAQPIADLTAADAAQHYGFDRATPWCEWRKLWMVMGQEPPTWALADHLMAQGAAGAIVPSVQIKGGRNLVLWRWSADAEEGAQVRVIDPLAELSSFLLH
jgi:RES domain-containing protein